MAKERGINLDITATTDSLKRELKSCLTVVSDLEKDLKKVNAQLKFNPSDTNLLKTKLDLLNDSVKKLESSQVKLNEEMRKANQLVEQGKLDRTNKEYVELATNYSRVKNKLNEYKTEIEATETALKGTANAQNDFGNSLTETVSKTNVLEGMLSNLASDLINKVASKFKELAKEVAQASMEIEYLESDLRALYGDNATEKAIQNVTKYAKDLSTQTVYTTQDIQKAMSFMARAGYDADQTIASVKSALDLAQATGEDSTRLASILVDGLTAFQMSAEESSRFANVLAVVANETNAEVTDLGQSFKYAGSLAGTFGYEVEDVAVALGVMASQGIKGSQAGTSLRSMFTRLATNTGKATEELDRLGIKFFDSTGNARDLLEVLEEMRSKLQGLSNEDLTSSLKIIGGQNAISGLTAVISATNEEWNSLKEAVSETGNYIEKVADIKTDNLQSDITKLKNSWEAFATDSVEPLLPAFRNVIQGLTEAFNYLRVGGDETYGSVKNLTEHIDASLETFTEMKRVVGENVLEYQKQQLEINETIPKILELQQAIKDGNLSEEESTEKKKTLKDMIDKLNTSLGQQVFYYNENSGLITDENGKVVDLAEAYKELAFQKQKAYTMDAYQEVYDQAISSQQQSLQDLRSAYHEADAYWQTASDDFKSRWEELQKLKNENYQAYQDMLVNDQELVAYSKLLNQLDSAEQKYNEVYNTTQEFITAFDDLGNATAETWSDKLKQLDLAEYIQSLNGDLVTMQEELQRINIELSNPEKYKLTQEEIDKNLMRKQWLEEQIQLEQNRIAQLELDNFKELELEWTKIEDKTKYNQEYLEKLDGLQETYTNNQTKRFKESIETSKNDLTEGITFMQTYLDANPLRLRVEVDIDGATARLRELGNTGDYAGSWISFDSGGWGALNSGGFNAGGITVNANFNITGNPNENVIAEWGYDLAEAINEALGNAI